MKDWSTISQPCPMLYLMPWKPLPQILRQRSKPWKRQAGKDDGENCPSNLEKVRDCGLEGRPTTDVSTPIETPLWPPKDKHTILT